MPDITMCTGTGCPVAERCYRKRAMPHPFWQSYFVSPPVREDGTCPHFWQVDERGRPTFTPEGEREHG